VAVVGLSARIYLDHNVRTQLTTELRSRHFDVVHAQDLGLGRASDEEHLEVAVEQGRQLVSHDQKDFKRIAAEWAMAERAHFGIVLARQPPALPYRAFVGRLLVILDERTAEEFVNLVRWI